MAMLHPIRPAAFGVGLLLALAACGRGGADTAGLALRDTAHPEAPPPVATRDKAPEAIRGILLNAYAVRQW